MTSGANVFVNYRRADADADAQWLAETLKDEFGEKNVFVDVDDIAGGDKLDSTINAALSSAKVLLAVIGPNWLSAKDEETGEPRINQEKDWVRREIETALRTELEIIPVLVGGVSGAIFKEKLPDSISELGNQKGMVVRPGHRREDQYEIASRIEELDIARSSNRDYRRLLDERFGDLLSVFASARPEIGERIRDFGDLIEERTRAFVGRQFVFDEIDQFFDDHTQGYFLLRGDPGIGKSAIAAHLVESRGYLHHFNVRSAGISTAKAFLENICAQLIVRYSLDYDALPAGACADNSVLEQLLNEAAEAADDRVVIVVDALDEVDLETHTDGANLLYLPRNLPEGAYFILTSRRLKTLPLMFESERKTFDIDQDSANNMDDVEQFLEGSLGRPGVVVYLEAQGIDSALFVTTLTKKSQGNFMYLRYVLREIEKGAYRSLDYKKLPQGLEDYYADHWRRIRTTDDSAWFDYKLPVVLALSETLEAVTIDVLMEFSGVSSRSRVRSVLNDWIEFLYTTQRAANGDSESLYRIYHDSFREFIASQEEVADERINRQDARRRIAESLWKIRHGAGLDEWLDRQIGQTSSNDQDGFRKSKQ